MSDLLTTLRQFMGEDERPNSPRDLNEWLGDEGRRAIADPASVRVKIPEPQPTDEPERILRRNVDAAVREIGDINPNSKSINEAIDKAGGVSRFKQELEKYLPNMDFPEAEAIFRRAVAEEVKAQRFQKHYRDYLDRPSAQKTMGVMPWIRHVSNTGFALRQREAAKAIAEDRATDDDLAVLARLQVDRDAAERGGLSGKVIEQALGLPAELAEWMTLTKPAAAISKPLAYAAYRGVGRAIPALAGRTLTKEAIQAGLKGVARTAINVPSMVSGTAQRSVPEFSGGPGGVYVGESPSVAKAARDTAISNLISNVVFEALGPFGNQTGRSWAKSTASGVGAVELSAEGQYQAGVSPQPSDLRRAMGGDREAQENLLATTIVFGGLEGYQHAFQRLSEKAQRLKRQGLRLDSQRAREELRQEAERLAPEPAPPEKPAADAAPATEAEARTTPPVASEPVAPRAAPEAAAPAAAEPTVADRIRGLYDRVGTDLSIPAEEVVSTLAPLDGMKKKELLQVAEQMEIAGAKAKRKEQIVASIRQKVLDRHSAAQRGRMIQEPAREAPAEVAPERTPPPAPEAQRAAEPAEPQVPVRPEADAEVADLMRSHSDALLRFIRTQMKQSLRTQVEPEDVLQEVMIAAHQHLQKQSLGETDPMRFLRGVAKHKIVDFSRKVSAQKRDMGRTQEMATESEGREAAPDAGAIRAERETAVAGALMTLSETERLALRLRHIDGLSEQEIAKRIGKTYDATRTMFSRITGKLQGRGESATVEGEVPADVQQLAKMIAEAGETKAGSLAYAAPGAPSIPVQMDPAGDKGQPISTHEIIRTMSRDFGVPINLSNIRGKALALYDQMPQAVRSRSDYIGDLAVMSHEVAHHFDRKTNILANLTPAMRSELKALDYDPQKNRIKEGFAEFTRHYLTTGRAAALAPQFYTHFESWLRSNPEYASKFEKTLTNVTRWREQGAAARVEANISRTGEDVKPQMSLWEKVKQRWKGSKDKFRYYMVDEFRYLENFTEEAKKKGAVFAEGDSPIEVARFNAHLAPTLAAKAFEEGPTLISDYRVKVGPGLREALSTVDPADYRDFVTWAYARHALEAHSKKINPGIGKADADHVYRTLPQTPERAVAWETAANKLTEFNNAMLDVLVDAGVITPESRDSMTNEWQTYLPLMRVRPGSVEAKKFGDGKTLVDLAAPLKRRTGGDMQIIDPVESMMERTAKFYSVALRQQVMNRIVETAKAKEGLGGWVLAEPPALEATHVKASEAATHVYNELIQAGAMPAEARLISYLIESGDGFDVFRPSYQNKSDQPIVRVIENGKPKMYRLDPDLYRFAKGMDQYRLPWILDFILGKPARLVRLGSTGANPDFAARNMANDAMSFMVQTEGNAATSIPRSLSTMIAFGFGEARAFAGYERDPVVKLYKEMGGELSHYIGLDRQEIASSVRDLMNNSTARRIHNVFVPPGWEQAPAAVKWGRALAVESPLMVARSVGKIASALSTAAEISPRLTEFKRVLERHGYDKQRIASGALPPPEVLRAAMIAAKDVTVDFGRSGHWGKVISQAVPFFNARIQSMDKYFRTWQDSPKRTLLRVASLAAATAAYWWARRGDDDYKESQPWLKYGFWTFTDAEGQPILRIPRTHEWGWTISAFVEALLNTMYERSPQAVEDYVQHATKSVAPDVIPAAFKPGTETAFGYDFFRGRDIVPKDRQGMEPRDQATDYNAPLIKAIGNYLNISPARLEHFLQASTGGGYRRVENLAQIATGNKPEAPDIPVIGGLAFRNDYGRSINEFYEQYDKLSRQRASNKLHGRDNSGTDVEFYKLDTFRNILDGMREGKKAVAEGGREARFDVEKYEIGLTRFATGKESLDRYPNPLATDRSKLPDAIREPVEKALALAAVQLTDPPPQPRPGEKREQFTERQKKYKMEVERAKAFLKDANATPAELHRLLVERERRAGRSAAAIAERAGRLRMLK